MNHSLFSSHGRPLARRLMMVVALFLLGLPAAGADTAAEPGQLVVDQNAEGRLQLFKVDKNGELRRRAQRDPDGEWASWSSLGGSLLSNIAVLSNLNGTCDVFAVDKTTRELQWISQKSPNGPWSDWVDLGGRVQAPVTVARNPAGGIEIFAADAIDSGLVHLWQTNSSGTWSGWSRLDGQIEPGMLVVQDQGGRLELLGVDAETKALLDCREISPGDSRQWSAWQNLGGSLQPSLAACRDSNGTMEVFGIDADSGMAERICRNAAPDDGGWTSWQLFGTNHPLASLTIAQNEDGRWELFAVNGQNSRVYHRWQTSPVTANWWPGWDDFEGQAQPGLAVGRNRDGSLEIFTVDPANGVKLNHKRQISANSDWLDWFSLEHSDLTYRAHMWKTDEGLPHNVVQALAQTPDGYLWVGTAAGLARFDGLRFVVFDSKTTPALKSQRVTALCVDGQGTLWIGTDGGLVQLKDGVFSRGATGTDLDTNCINALCRSRDGAIWIGTDAGLSHFGGGTIKRYTRADGLLTDSVRTAFEDRSGALWIGSAAGLNCLRGGQFESITTVRGLPNNSIRGITQDRGGRLWFGSDDGMIWHHEGTAFHAYDRRYGLSDNFVSSVCEDREGTLWVGTFSGLNRFKDGQFLQQLNNEGAPFDKVNAIFQDRDGNIWVASNEGLIQLTPKRFQSFDMRRGFSHNNVVSVLEDHDGNLWAGTWGGGLNKMTDEIMTWYSATNGLVNDQVLGLCESRDGSLWIGEDFGGGLTRLQKGRFTHYGVGGGLINADGRVIHEDRAGRLWVGTSQGLDCLTGGKWVTYTTASHLAGNSVRAICEDHAGVLWFGTDQGLSRLEGGRFASFTTRNGLSDNSVTALFEDEENSLWIGTAGGGLNRYEGGAFKSYTTQQGLFSDEIFEIIEDDYGWLWMSCSKGIFRVQISDFASFDRGEHAAISSVCYGTADGMESSLCNNQAKPAAWKSQDGKLWFATTKGLVVVNPDIKVNETHPQVFIEQVQVDNKVVSQSVVGKNNNGQPGAPLTFGPGLGNLDFQFTAIDFEKPEKDRFLYMLKGSDQDWVDAGSRRTAHYSNLRPGGYVFMVKACNANGVWNPEGDALAIVLRAHYWQTWWFTLILVAAVIALVSTVARQITKQRMERRMQWLEREHAVESERARIAKDIHDDLGSRLTRIMLLGLRTQEDIASPEKLAIHAQKIVDSAVNTMQTMDEIVWAVDPKKDTLDGLIGYINQYAREFFENTPVKCRLEMPVEVPDLTIPAVVRHELFLVLKEALNNVAKHAKASEVRLHLAELDGKITVTVEDNGCGIASVRPRPDKKRNGLDNMSKRITRLGGEFSLDTPASGRGTVVRFSVNVGPGFRPSK